MKLWFAKKDEYLDISFWSYLKFHVLGIISILGIYTVMLIIIYLL